MGRQWILGSGLLVSVAAIWAFEVASSSPDTQSTDIEAKVLKAFEKVQQRCKDNKALHGLASAKIDGHTLRAQTDGWWDNLPSKFPPYHDRGHGRLDIRLVSSKEGLLDSPAIDPPGCFTGRTELHVGKKDDNTVLVSTQSSDPDVHQMLVEMVVEELRAVGLDPQTTDSPYAIGSPAKPGPASKPDSATTRQAVSPDLDQLLAAVGQDVDSDAVKSLQQAFELKVSHSYLASQDEAFLLLSKIPPQFEELRLSIRRPPGSRFGNYDKALPLGLNKNDTPEQVMKKLGKPSTYALNERNTGGLYYMKAWPDKQLHVLFIDGQMEELRVKFRENIDRDGPGGGMGPPGGTIKSPSYSYTSPSATRPTR